MSGDISITAAQQDFWRGWLEPGERLLWAGRPRRGLRLWHVEPAEALRILAYLATAALIVFFGRDVADPDFRPIVIVAAGAAVLTAIATPVLRARRLMNSRYAVTDRRAIVLSGWAYPGDMFDLLHDATAPRELPERWGTTVFVGRRALGVPRSWQKWTGWTANGDHWRENVIFYRLDPAENPRELLESLRKGGDVPLVLRVLTMPGILG
ncbi:MAG TPA: hypothetical protein PLL33_09585 [Paracoccus sp. (in: a-proteobacteria)]|nr:hypothetical protein [Paracoccus sp. (in: a-proteobacteria)]